MDEFITFARRPVNKEIVLPYDGRLQVQIAYPIDGEVRTLSDRMSPSIYTTIQFDYHFQGMFGKGLALYKLLRISLI